MPMREEDAIVCELRLIVSVVAVGVVGLTTQAGAATLQAQVNNTNAFLVANGLQSAVISLTGFSDGQSVQGIVGTFDTPWTVTTTGSGFSNSIAGVGPEWSGPGFDSGFLPSDGRSPFGTPGGDLISFGSPAAFAITGTNTIHPKMTWLSLDPNGVAVDSSTVIPILRLTWSNAHSATVSFFLVMNTPGESVPMSITIPAVPGPSVLATCCVVAGVGRRRARHR